MEVILALLAILLLIYVIWAFHIETAEKPRHKPKPLKDYDL